MAIGAVLVVSFVLAVSAPARGRVFERIATLTRLSGDSSLSYRVHFGRAALAMLRDHPLTGVGWENFGLLYPRYRSSPTPAIGPDLVPTMVHSGPLQAAVSGGAPGSGPGDAVLRRASEPPLPGARAARPTDVNGCSAPPSWPRVSPVSCRTSRAGPTSRWERWPSCSADSRSPGAREAGLVPCREADGRSRCSPRRSARGPPGCRSTPGSAFGRSG